MYLMKLNFEYREVDSTFKCNQSYKETPWQKNVKEFLYICNGKNSVRHCAYTYDHSDRISSVTHKLNNGSKPYL